LINIDDFDEKELLDPRVSIYRQNLIRKGYLTLENKLTLEGKDILSFLSDEKVQKLPKKKDIKDDFERWWDSFPKTPNFTYKNRSFTGDRSFKFKKEECRLKMKAILNEGNYSIDDMIGALNLEVQLKMENSVKTGKNQLIYLKATLAYLNSGLYEGFIDLYRKQGLKKEEEIFNDTYI
jgi:hypothetical protein